MSLSRLLGTVVIAGAVGYAGYCLTSPKEEVPMYLNPDLRKDLVVKDYLNRTKIFLGSSEGLKPLDDTGLPEWRKQKIRERAERHLNK